MKLLTFAALFWAATAAAQPPPTGLFLRGYSVIPTPQKVVLHSGEILVDDSWDYYAEQPAGIASRSLVRDFDEFHAIRLRPAPAPGRRTVVLRVAPGTVREAPLETAAQAYRILIAPDRIEITGNGGPGLLYGVQTLVQLVKENARGRLAVPACEIVDWPRYALRFLHWDTKHHQDRIPTLKRYIDWAVRFKANMIGFELEDKFSYPSNPVIGAPGAFTPTELQEIVDYGLERFLQVVPVIQSPAHMSYVLKHPQFAHLRADGNNYQSDLCQEETYRLIFQMYDDVIAATRGVDYFFVSTDEVYYAGIGSRCKQPYTPENRSAAWADFAIRARNHLAGRGRRMLAWLEYPLLPKDLERIPDDVIDGVVGEESFVAIEKRKGMRQLIYTSTQGAELLFPDHLAIESLPPGVVMGEFEEVFTPGRLASLYESIRSGRAARMNPIGVFGAAWDDSGLHNETFWLGWSAVARWGWHPGLPSPAQHAVEFMRVYYGPRTEGMIEIYRNLQRQARTWQRCWDRVPSRVRGPGYGNSEGPGIGAARQDLTLTPPPLPDPETLAFEPRFTTKYRTLIAEAAAQNLQNDQVEHALLANIPRASRNQYNLEVLLSLVRFTGHHWRLIRALAQAEADLAKAASLHLQNEPAQAVGSLVSAHNQIARMEAETARIRRYLTAVWERSRMPKDAEVKGRPFVHVLDDTKDHWAGRTPGLDYMFQPEQSLGLAGWLAQLRQIADGYAKRNHITASGYEEDRLEQ